MQNLIQLQFRHRIPEIGSKVIYCPHCKRPLSYSDKMGMYCRGCQAATREAMKQYIKVLKEGR